MKKFIVMLIAILGLFISTQAQIKPSQMSTATVEAFKEKLGLNNSVTATDTFYRKSEIDAKEIALKQNKNDIIEWYRTQGDSIKLTNCLFHAPGTGSVTLSDGELFMIPAICEKTVKIYNISFVPQVQGVFTGDNTNAIGLYSYDGTTSTLIASTANDANIWKGTADAIKTVSFSTPVTITAGRYRIGFLYNSSTPTTAPAIHSSINTALYYPAMNVMSNNKFLASKTGQASLPATITDASLGNANKNIPTIILK